MLRLTDIKLPLDHNEDALPQAIISKLGITAGDLLETSVFKRGYDARNNKDIQLIYTVDVSVNHEKNCWKNLPLISRSESRRICRISLLRRHRKI